MDDNKNGIISMIENLSASSEETSASTQEVAASIEEQLAGMQEINNYATKMEELSKNLTDSINKLLRL